MQQGGNQANFSVVTTSKSGKNSKTGLIVGALAVVFLGISVAVGVYLVKQQQDIREKAAAALVCPAAEACPVAGQTSLLRSCYSGATGDAPQEISCSTIANVGTTAICGSTKYCCPSLGAAWTTDLTACTSPTPVPTPTIEATVSASPTATASATATAKSTATASATPVIPVTGTNWPTMVGAGVGVLIIVGSILLVL